MRAVRGSPRKRVLVAAAIGVAALTGGFSATHARAQGPPSCSFLFFNDGSDAPNPITGGGQVPNLDIIEGGFGLTADGSTLRAVLTIQNQDFTFLTGANAIDYQMFFSFGSVNGTPVEYATDASLTFNPSGAPLEAFSDGTVQIVNNPAGGGLLFSQYAPNPAGHATGSFGPAGANERIEVDVPLSDLNFGGNAPPAIGNTLTKTAGLSAEGQGTQAQGNEFISDQDPSTSTFGNDYKIGQATCISAAFVQPAGTVPEAPLASLLLSAGAAALLGSGLAWRRRRRISPRG